MTDHTPIKVRRFCRVGQLNWFSVQRISGAIPESLGRLSKLVNLYLQCNELSGKSPVNAQWYNVPMVHRIILQNDPIVCCDWFQAPSQRALDTCPAWDFFDSLTISSVVSYEFNGFFIFLYTIDSDPRYIEIKSLSRKAYCIASYVDKAHFPLWKIWRMLATCWVTASTRGVKHRDTSDTVFMEIVNIHFVNRSHLFRNCHFSCLMLVVQRQFRPLFPFYFFVVSGAIPDSLGHLSNLTHLYLHNNQLVGEFRTWETFQARKPIV